MAAEARELVERLAADLATGDREAALKAFIEGLSGPGRWEQLSSDQKSILFDNAATAIGPEARPPLSCEMIRKFQFPVLTVIGEKSPSRYGEMARAMRNCLPERVREPVIIPDAAHGMNLVNPQAFNSTVHGFLSDR